MKEAHRANTRSLLLSALVLSSFAIQSQAYYHPDEGRWLSRDPIGDIGFDLQAGGRFRSRPFAAHLYLFVRNNPRNRVDVLGLQECDFCGPDVTDFFANLINSAVKWRSGFKASRWDGMNWMHKNGMSLDWLSMAGSYKVTDSAGKCLYPSGTKCANTYWLCGECVHDHWIGNFMYAFIGRLFYLPDWMVDTGGEYAQGKVYDDPPWDTVGYDIARNLFDKLESSSSSVTLCATLKEDADLWKQANDTSVTGKNYPKPHAKDYKDCAQCPYALPASVTGTVPGGKFGGSWPSIK